MNDEPMLTTIDNPYSPYTQWDEWLAFDTQKGYNTINYLARIADSCSTLGEEEENDQINTAIDEIVSYNFIGMYKKAYRSDYEKKN